MSERNSSVVMSRAVNLQAGLAPFIASIQDGFTARGIVNNCSNLMYAGAKLLQKVQQNNSLMLSKGLKLSKNPFPQ